jgi:hypothetical protein
MARTQAPRPRSLPRYGSLARFYDADPRRVSSRELDFGLWWRERVSGPLHRAAWVADTGELYVVALGPPDDGGGCVEVLAHADDREQLERALAGWRERCGQPGSLTWLRRRATRLSAPQPQPVLLLLTPEGSRVKRYKDAGSVVCFAHERPRTP